MTAKTDKASAGSFPAELAHDMRAPLAAIAGFAEALADGTVPLEKQKLYLGVIASEARRLARLADCVFTAARLEEGAVKPRFSGFSLTELAKRALLSFEKPAENKRLSVSFSSEGEVRAEADADLIERVVTNLIENAVKYTKAGGKVQVNLSQTADKAVFTVKNEAENPPSDDELSHIAERFYRTESAKSGGEAGTGLGLYIVKAALALHGEELRAESAGNGTVSFGFSLEKA